MKCTNCEKELKSIVEWQTVSNAYEYSAENPDGVAIDTIGGDIESYACPHCGEDLPPYESRAFINDLHQLDTKKPLETI